MMKNTLKQMTMAEGGGGGAAARWIASAVLPRFAPAEGSPLGSLPDASLLEGGSLLFSTDSFVVSPREFPGGNIGKLAVCGTVNDLAVSGGIPKYLSLALIVEEGFDCAELDRILDAVKATADACGVSVVTGDTKVVGKGSCDGLFINTAGIGLRDPALDLGREKIRPGDEILVSGSIGDHALTITALRHGVSGEGLCSDCAPVLPQTRAASVIGGTGIRFMRDPTRGGTGAVLEEIFSNTKLDAEIDEEALPVRDSVKTLCGMFGIDPLFAACEGRVVCVADPAVSEALLDAWRELPGGEMACRIGRVTGAGNGTVALCGRFGGRRKLIVPDGELLPRIC